MPSLDAEMSGTAVTLFVLLGTNIRCPAYYSANCKTPEPGDKAWQYFPNIHILKDFGTVRKFLKERLVKNYPR